MKRFFNDYNFGVPFSQVSGPNSRALFNLEQAIQGKRDARIAIPPNVVH
jgi:hypothetical protein